MQMAASNRLEKIFHVDEIFPVLTVLFLFCHFGAQILLVLTGDTFSTQTGTQPQVGRPHRCRDFIGCGVREYFPTHHLTLFLHHGQGL